MVGLYILVILQNLLWLDQLFAWQVEFLPATMSVAGNTPGSEWRDANGPLWNVKQNRQ
jgi:hypothetical protein